MPLSHELNSNEQICLYNFVAFHGTYISLTLFVCTTYGASVRTVPHCTNTLLNYLYSKAEGTDVQLVVEKSGSVTSSATASTLYVQLSIFM